MKTLKEGGVIFNNFMPHTSKKNEILESLEKHAGKLIWNNISMTDSFRSIPHWDELLGEGSVVDVY